MTSDEHDELMTLDPPGTIAVIGAGPIGIEAALYGRFLGYDVKLIEADCIAASWRDQFDQELPMLPDRSLSPLALSALDAQENSAPLALPTTIESWVQDFWEHLTRTDLLRGCLLMPARVAAIDTISVSADDDDLADDPNVDISDDLPPDFRLSLEWKPRDDDEPAERPTSIDVEAIILTCPTTSKIQRTFSIPAPYFFSIEHVPSHDAESMLANGLRQIVEIYAGLAGRADLDLYRPPRG